ncbi:uncharacterized protein ARMOST_18881 [Armillaria ostoyae]|uniref:Uncharacterized protein n=1 Tax=Armillaria ostoyae TaxID=47428 RepID=A0A284S308_ARMOS|nr:uncharacterized protein ARMOST_18881 [Armillaria ostoyae]
MIEYTVKKSRYFDITTNTQRYKRRRTHPNPRETHMNASTHHANAEFSWPVSFNYRHKHRSNKSTEERGGHSISATLQFAPHSSEDSTAETNIRIPFQDIHTFNDTPKGTLGQA